MEENQNIKNQQKGSSVLITGGSGLIGRHLTSLLLSEGYNVSHLSTRSSQPGKVRVFRWAPDKGLLESSAVDGVDFIVHFAGANIGEKRWTKKRKAEIVSSRVASSELLFRVIQENDFRPKAFITASAVGYYGSVSCDKIFVEEDLPGNDFLGTTCARWEKAADLFREIGIRTVKIRTGLVLEKNDSALSKMMIPANFGFLVLTGNGKQFMPWIHICDLCNIYLKAIQDISMNGVYNAVSPQYVTHMDFIETLAKVMGKAVFPFPIPAFILRGILGEMSDVILKGSRVSSEKLTNSGYVFLHPEILESISHVLNY